MQHLNVGEDVLLKGKTVRTSQLSSGWARPLALRIQFGVHNGREAKNQNFAWNDLKFCQRQATCKTRIVQAVRKCLPGIYSEKRLTPKNERPTEF